MFLLLFEFFVVTFRSIGNECVFPLILAHDMVCGRFPFLVLNT